MKKQLQKTKLSYGISSQIRSKKSWYIAILPGLSVQRLEYGFDITNITWQIIFVWLFWYAVITLEIEKSNKFIKDV